MCIYIYNIHSNIVIYIYTYTIQYRYVFRQLLSLYFIFCFYFLGTLNAVRASRFPAVSARMHLSR